MKGGDVMKTPEQIWNEVTDNGTRIMKYYMFVKALEIYKKELEKRPKK